MAVYRYDAISGKLYEVTRREIDPTVHIIDDNAREDKGYLWHPAFDEHEQDKAYFSSKSRFRAETKARGFEEVGESQSQEVERRRRDNDRVLESQIRDAIIEKIKSYNFRKN